MINQHFLDIPAKTASDPACRYALLPVPYERTVSFGTGTAKGPAAIVNASKAIELFDEELEIPLDIDIQTLPALKFGHDSDKQSLKKIYSAAVKEMQKKSFVLSLGGEHTVSGPLIAAAKESFGDLTVLQLDAHTDLRDEYRGTALSHACVMRRARDLKLKTVHVGIRSCCNDEYRYMRSNRIPVFWAMDIVNSPRTKWIREIIGQLTGKVYLTIDIDVFNPSLVPGTGTPEPGGMSWYDVLALVREVVKQRQVVSADIVETAPFKGSQVSEYVAARLATRLLMYHKHRDNL